MGDHDRATPSGAHRVSGTRGGSGGLTVVPWQGRPGLRMTGEVGLATRAVWQGALDRAVDAHWSSRVYWLELSAVTFVDVAGTGALAAAANRLDDGRRLLLYRPPTTLRRALGLFWPDHEGIEVSLS
ncbi:STAS domain-containing protein [Streptomyces sp. 7R007]